MWPGSPSTRSPSGSPIRSTTFRERPDAHTEGLHRRRRLPHPQRQGRAGHERVDAGRLQPRLEARRGPRRAAAIRRCSPPIPPSASRRPRADRLRQGVVDNPGVPAEGPATPTLAGSTPRSCRRISSQGRYTAGLATHYPPVAADRATTHQALATGFVSACAFIRRPSFGSRTPPVILAMWPAPTAPGASTPSRTRTPRSSARCDIPGEIGPSRRSGASRRRRQISTASSTSARCISRGIGISRSRTCRLFFFRERGGSG